MKILRSKGQSHTTLETLSGQQKAKLARGLSLKAEKLLTPESYRDQRDVSPPQLPDYVGDDYALILRQTISALDKVIRKPRSLRNFEKQAYIDRTLLAGELWKRICDICKQPILALPEGGKAFDYFEAMWRSKVHPYAVSDADPFEPWRDANAKQIEKGRKKLEEQRLETKQRDYFQGRWHNAFWRERSNGTADYQAIADAIWSHLFVQEGLIVGEPRKDRKQSVEGREEGRIHDIVGEARKDGKQSGKPTGRGLIETRGLSMRSSAADPRVGRSPKRTQDWSKQVEGIYFEEDVAAKIFSTVTGQANRPEFFNASQFGDILYRHFGALGITDPETKKQAWALHNRVRTFYQKLAKSERFRRAFKESPSKRDEREKLAAIVPAEKYALLRVIDAKEQAADVGDLIRLGKLVAHAADMAGSHEPEERFTARMDQLVTSAGQSEIKRNESFTRVWRTAVGLSLRTLRIWADPDGKAIGDEGDRDLAGPRVSQNAIQKQFDDARYKAQARLVFGSGDIGGQSRSSLFVGTEKQDKEMLWTMLRLAGEVRDRTNHFNTKWRLVRVVSEGPLHANPNPPAFEQRGKRIVHADSLATFDRLLGFDIQAQNVVVAKVLNDLDLTRYVTGGRLKSLLNQLASTPEQGDILAPKFMSVLKRAKNLATSNPDELLDPIRRFGELDLEKLSSAPRSANTCRIGILRLLYARGFRSWLASRQTDTLFIKAAIRSIVDAKMTRVSQANEEQNRYYAMARSRADDIGIDESKTLDELFAELAAWGAREGGENLRYRADREKQKKHSNELEDFRRDLFAWFLGTYIAETLDWVWELNESDGSGAAPVEAKDLAPAHWDHKPWHSQFYAWLYLVPSDDVALLRHQLRKTLVLEGHRDEFRKTPAIELSASHEKDADLAETLIDMDRLMGLYTAVQSAGFGGTEHVDGLDIRHLLYDDPGLFGQVYSEEMETHHLTIPGTRRGLRQILRFGHLDVLKSILEKHRVTAGEVRQFAELRSPEVAARQSMKISLHKDIVRLAKSRDGNKSDLRDKCVEYRELAIWNARDVFAINAARLTEHARLHHLMMRVVARLADFTLMWERDRHFLFLGMLYRELQRQGDAFVVSDRAERIGVTLTGACLERLRGNAKTQRGINASDIESGFLPLWDETKGLILTEKMQSALLSDKDRRVFSQYFAVSVENPKDVAWWEARGTTESDRKYRLGKPRIRNDFAHFNVIGTSVAGRDRKRLNLTYLVNAVRSLFGYDRKLKNAVSKAVADILYDEGLIVRWELHHDRLRNPTVLPRLETHLSMVRPIEETSFRFELPQASARYTSMVKALFDFDTGGYREPIKRDGEWKRRGILRYPISMFPDGYGETMPKELLHDAFPELAPEAK